MQGDILKITIYDQYHTKYFETEIRINKKELKELDAALRVKGLRIINLEDVGFF